MPAISLSCLRRQCCFCRFQLIDKQLRRARNLISKQRWEDVEAALGPLDSALKIDPHCEVALELKARALLYLKRFEEVVELLHELLPNGSQQCSPPPPKSFSSKEKTRLLSDYLPEQGLVQGAATRCKRRFTAMVAEFMSSKFSTGVNSSKGSKLRKQWRYLVVGQACYHLGMLEDALVLLQVGKRTASAASRRQSNCLRDDKFCLDMKLDMPTAESSHVNHMLSNIKVFLRRRVAAIAALEAGLYEESVRHFSKIIDGRKGAPQGFIADCYLHRAIAYQATGRVVDAIADCNRNLALTPNCTKALSVRASLYELVGCFSDCLLDLQHLKMIYEAAVRSQAMVDLQSSNHSSDIDFAGGLDYINSRITITRHRLASSRSLDAYMVLDLPRNCATEDVEKAYLLLSLKHMSDKAATFVERCEFMNGRKIESAREEACASSQRLSHLIHRAYTKLLATIAEADDELGKHEEILTVSWAIPTDEPLWHEHKEEAATCINAGFMSCDAGCNQNVGGNHSICGVNKSITGSNLSSTVLANAISQALSVDYSANGMVPINADKSASPWINPVPVLSCHIAY